LALAHVRKLALFKKESLVNSICDTFASYNGREPSINDISAIFGRVKQALALEAVEDEMNEQYEEIEDEVDSDYHPNDDSFDYDFDQDINEKCYISSSEDSDYDPDDAEDIKQVEADLEEDFSEDEEEEDAVVEDEQISYDEETIISSKDFDAEYFEAIQCVVNAAKLEKERIYAKICKKYETEFGDEVIEKAFEQFVDFEFEQEANDNNEEQEVEEQEEEKESVYEELEQESAVESEEYRIEMEYALNNVRRLAAKHKERFVDGVCDAFKSLNGSEPSASELSAVFKAIRMEFAEEAREEYLSDIAEEEEEEEEVVNVD